MQRIELQERRKKERTKRRFMNLVRKQPKEEEGAYRTCLRRLKTESVQEKHILIQRIKNTGQSQIVQTVVSC